MSIQSTTFRNFKPYNYYAKNCIYDKPCNKNLKKYIRPWLGSALGVSIGYLATKNVKLKNHRILDELLHLLAMAGGANFMSVLVSSIGETPEKIKAKVKEAQFQIMNTSIPMLLVGGANSICDKTKASYPIRILASAAAMLSGAFIATKITNINNQNEPKRKYSIKDSVANIDDIIATIAIGFPQLKKLHLDWLMHFIYTYCGSRAGSKE